MGGFNFGAAAAKAREEAPVEAAEAETSEISKADAKLESLKLGGVFEVIFASLEKKFGGARLNKAMKWIEEKAKEKEDHSLLDLLAFRKKEIEELFIDAGCLNEIEWNQFKTKKRTEYEASFPESKKVLASLDPVIQMDISVADFEGLVSFLPDPLADPEMVAAFAESRKKYLVELWDKWQQKIENYKTQQNQLVANLESQIQKLTVPNLDPLANADLSQAEFLKYFSDLDYSNIDSKRTGVIREAYLNKTKQLWASWEWRVEQAQAVETERLKVIVNERQKLEEAEKVEQKEKVEREAKKLEECELLVEPEKPILYEINTPEVAEDLEPEKSILYEISAPEVVEDLEAETKKRQENLEQALAQFLPETLKTSVTKRPQNLAALEVSFFKKYPDLKADYFDFRTSREQVKACWQAWERQKSATAKAEAKEDARQHQSTLKALKVFGEKIKNQEAPSDLPRFWEYFSAQCPALVDVVRQSPEYLAVLKAQFASFKTKPLAVDINQKLRPVEAKIISNTDEKSKTNECKESDTETENPSEETLPNAPEFDWGKLNISKEKQATVEKRWQQMQQDPRLKLATVIRNHPMLKNFILQALAILPNDKFARLPLALQGVSMGSGTSAETIAWLQTFCDTAGLEYLQSQIPQELSTFKGYFQKQLKWRPLSAREAEAAAVKESEEDDEALTEADIEKDEESKDLEEDVDLETPSWLKEPDDDPEIDESENGLLPTIQEEPDLLEKEIYRVPVLEMTGDDSKGVALGEEAVDSFDLDPPEDSKDDFFEEVLEDDIPPVPETGEVLMDDEEESDIYVVDDGALAEGERTEESNELELDNLGYEEVLKLEFIGLADEILDDFNEEPEVPELPELPVDEDLVKTLLADLSFENLDDDFDEKKNKTVEAEKHELATSRYNSLRERTTTLSVSHQALQVVIQLRSYALEGDSASFEALLAQLDLFLRHLVLQQLRLQGVLMPQKGSLIDMFGATYFSNDDSVWISQIFQAVEHYIYLVYGKRIKVPLPMNQQDLKFNPDEAFALFNKTIRRFEETYLCRKY